MAPATGLAALAVGAAAVALQRPWPDTLEPAGFPAFLADNRAAVVAQSLLFLVSAGLFMWFLGSLRATWCGWRAAPPGCPRSPSARAWSGTGWRSWDRRLRSR